MITRLSTFVSLAAAAFAGSLSLAPLALAAGAGSGSDSFLPTADTAVTTEADAMVYEVRVRLLHGPSQFLDGLDTALDISKLKLVYLDEPSCPRAPYASLYVRSVADGKWYPTTLASDVLTHSAGAFNALRFEFDNPYGTMSCNFRLYAVDDGGTDQPDSPWGPGVRVGGIQYNGGFTDTVALEIDPARKVRGFRVALPAFCSQVEILEAGTVTEGVFEPANLVDGTTSTFAVGADGPIRARQVQFALNGPATSACYVPVYAYYVQ